MSSGLAAHKKPAFKLAYSRETATSELFHELLPLLRMHWAEIAHFKDIPLKPDVAKYLRLEAMGILRVFVAREITVSDRSLSAPEYPGQVRGYCVYMVQPNMHYSSSVQAIQDILYLEPGSRGALRGYYFLKWCDEQLRAEGVQAAYQHSKAKHDIGPLLERLGYELVDKIYARRLDK